LASYRGNRGSQVANVLVGSGWSGFAKADRLDSTKDGGTRSVLNRTRQIRRQGKFSEVCFRRLVSTIGGGTINTGGNRMRDDEDYRLPVCASCGDVLGDTDSSLPYDVQDAMRAYCLTCAKEVLGIAIPKVGTLQHGSGGGWRVIRETKTH
jgi:hypothetical protein